MHRMKILEELTAYANSAFIFQEEKPFTKHFQEFIQEHPALRITRNILFFAVYYFDRTKVCIFLVE